MRFVVTGGTGFVGSALVRRLEARGDEAVVLSRSERAPRGKIRTIAWTPGQRGPWTEALRGADAVVNLAGANLFDARWTPERIDEIKKSRIDATRVLAEAMVAECKDAALVSASAVGIYGMRKDDVALGEDAPHGKDVLTEICEAWEAAASPAAEAGVRVTHPRIGIVLGRGGGALEKMIPAYRAFVGGPIGDGRQWISWIHLDDVVDALLFLAENRSCSGAYNATAPEPVTMNELSRALGHAMHRPALFRVPSAALKLVMGAGRADVLLTGQRALPKRLTDAGFQFRYRALEPALADVLR